MAVTAKTVETHGGNGINQAIVRRRYWIPPGADLAAVDGGLGFTPALGDGSVPGLGGHTGITGVYWFVFSKNSLLEGLVYELDILALDE